MGWAAWILVGLVLGSVLPATEAAAASCSIALRGSKPDVDVPVVTPALNTFVFDTDGAISAVHVMVYNTSGYVLLESVVPVRSHVAVVQTVVEPVLGFNEPFKMLARSAPNGVPNLDCWLSLPVQHQRCFFRATALPAPVAVPGENVTLTYDSSRMDSVSWSVVHDGRVVLSGGDQGNHGFVTFNVPTDWAVGENYSLYLQSAGSYGCWNYLPFVVGKIQ